jgi:diguanylate cyclase (GGDEF)-like protein/PAS domain S-box-containing protein
MPLDTPAFDPASPRRAGPDGRQDRAPFLAGLRAAVGGAAALGARLAAPDEDRLCQVLADCLHEATTAPHTFLLVGADAGPRLVGWRSRDGQAAGRGAPDATRILAAAHTLLDGLNAGDVADMCIDGVGVAAVPLAADGAGVLGALCMVVDDATSCDAARLAELAAAGAARLAWLRLAADMRRQRDAHEHELGAHGVLRGSLSDQNSLLRTLIDHMPDQIYAKDANGRFLVANRAAAMMILGAPDTEALIGKSDLDFYPLECGQRFFTDEQAIIRSGVPIIDQVEENLSKEGVLRFYSTTKFPFRDDTGAMGGIVGISREITLRVGPDEAAKLRDRAVESSQDGIVITATNHGNAIVYTNPAFERITGFTFDEARASGIERFLLDHDELADSVAGRDALIARHGERRVLRSLRPDGSQFWSEVRLAVIRAADGSSTHNVFTLSDVTDAHRAEQELTLLASHDPLTGLLNRRSLMDKLGQAIGSGVNGDVQLAVAFIDLDGLKRLNDEHGHEAGDVLLRTVAERIAGCIRQTDTIARLGGDEFVLITQHRSGRASGDPAGAAGVLRKIQERIAQPIAIGDIVVNATCSIGVSLLGRHGTNPDALIRRADEAMYVAKKSGRNRIVFADDPGAPPAVP